MTRHLTRHLLCIALASAPLAATAADSGTTSTTTTTATTTSGSTSSTFDMRTRELRIPCLEVRGVVVQGKAVEDAKYDVVMKQRGNSANWEVTFANPGCAGTMPPADQP